MKREQNRAKAVIAQAKNVKTVGRKSSIVTILKYSYYSRQVVLIYAYISTNFC